MEGAGYLGSAARARVTDGMTRMFELTMKNEAATEDFIDDLSDEALDRDGEGGRGLPQLCSRLACSGRASRVQGPID